MSRKRVREREGERECVCEGVCERERARGRECVCRTFLPSFCGWQKGRRMCHGRDSTGRLEQARICKGARAQVGYEGIVGPKWAERRLPYP